MLGSLNIRKFAVDFMGFLWYKSNFSLAHTRINNSPLSNTENVDCIQESEAKIELSISLWVSWAPYAYQINPLLFVTWTIVHPDWSESLKTEASRYVHSTQAAIRTNPKCVPSNSISMWTLYLSHVEQICIGKSDKIHTFKWSWNCVKVLQS